MSVEVGLYTHISVYTHETRSNSLRTLDEILMIIVSGLRGLLVLSLSLQRVY